MPYDPINLLRQHWASPDDLARELYVLFREGVKPPPAAPSNLRPAVLPPGRFSAPVVGTITPPVAAHLPPVQVRRQTAPPAPLAAPVPETRSPSTPPLATGRPAAAPQGATPSTGALPLPLPPPPVPVAANLISSVVEQAARPQQITAASASPPRRVPTAPEPAPVTLDESAPAGQARSPGSVPVVPPVTRFIAGEGETPRTPTTAVEGSPRQTTAAGARDPQPLSPLLTARDLPQAAALKPASFDVSPLSGTPVETRAVPQAEVFEPPPPTDVPPFYGVYATPVLTGVNGIPPFQADVSGNTLGIPGVGPGRAMDFDGYGIQDSGAPDLQLINLGPVVPANTVVPAVQVLEEYYWLLPPGAQPFIAICPAGVAAGTLPPLGSAFSFKAQVYLLDTNDGSYDPVEIGTIFNSAPVALTAGRGLILVSLGYQNYLVLAQFC